MSSTEIAIRERSPARHPMRVLNLRLVPRRRRRGDLADVAAYVHDNWRRMSPAQAAVAGGHIGRLLTTAREARR